MSAIQSPQGTDDLLARARAEAAEAVPSRITTEVPVASSGRLRIPVEVREDYLTPEDVDGDAIVQASFDRLKVAVISEEQHVLLKLPLLEPCIGKQPYTRSISDWRINVKKWVDTIPTTPEGEAEAQLVVLPKTDAIEEVL